VRLQKAVVKVMSIVNGNGDFESHIAEIWELIIWTLTFLQRSMSGDHPTYRIKGLGRARTQFITSSDVIGSTLLEK